jgi:hypothetical protein
VKGKYDSECQQGSAISNKSDRKGSVKVYKDRLSTVITVISNKSDRKGSVKERAVEKLTLTAL